MNKPFTPNSPYLLVHWDDLETAWRMLASPEKQDQITTILDAVRTLDDKVGQQKAIFTMIAATAWLTDERTPPDGPASDSGWPI